MILLFFTGWFPWAFYGLMTLVIFVVLQRNLDKRLRDIFIRDKKFPL